MSDIPRGRHRHHILIDIVGIGVESTAITNILIDIVGIGVEGTVITSILIDIAGIWGGGYSDCDHTD